MNVHINTKTILDAVPATLLSLPASSCHLDVAVVVAHTRVSTIWPKVNYSVS